MELLLSRDKEHVPNVLILKSNFPGHWYDYFLDLTSLNCVWTLNFYDPIQSLNGLYYHYYSLVLIYSLY